jgi:hypothetical protein
VRSSYKHNKFGGKTKRVKKRSPRTGRSYWSELPITKQYGPTLLGVLENRPGVLEGVMDRGQDKLDERLTSKINFVINGGRWGHKWRLEVGIPELVTDALETSLAEVTRPTASRNTLEVHRETKLGTDPAPIDANDRYTIIAPAEPHIVKHDGSDPRKPECMNADDYDQVFYSTATASSPRRRRSRTTRWARASPPT